MKRTSKTVMKFWLLGAAAVLVLGCAGPPEPADIVIRGGRVMDPETGFDRVADVAVRAGQIVAIGENLGEGRDELDATGLIVAPGFVDILASVPPNRHAQTHKITDGVTTCFGMHGGPIDVGAYRSSFEASGALVNYGATVGHARLRRAVGADDRYLAALPEQIEKMKELAADAIRSGAAGVGFGVNYTPGASYEEIFALFEVAAAHEVPCHLHARYKGNVFPGTMSLAAMEVIAIAAATGAQAQLAHLASSTVGSMPLCLELVEGAQARGVGRGVRLPRLDPQPNGTQIRSL